MTLVPELRIEVHRFERLPHDQPYGKESEKETDPGAPKRPEKAGEALRESRCADQDEPGYEPLRPGIKKSCDERGGSPERVADESRAPDTLRFHDRQNIPCMPDQSITRRRFRREPRTLQVK